MAKAKAAPEPDEPVVVERITRTGTDFTRYELTAEGEELVTTAQLSTEGAEVLDEPEPEPEPAPEPEPEEGEG